MVCSLKLSLRQNKIKFFKITLQMNTVIKLKQSSEKITKEEVQLFISFLW